MARTVMHERNGYDDLTSLLVMIPQVERVSLWSDVGRATERQLTILFTDGKAVEVEGNTPEELMHVAYIMIDHYAPKTLLEERTEDE